MHEELPAYDLSLGLAGLPHRWQAYFENLYHLVREMPAEQARSQAPLWRQSS
ncbi:hypothetical protein ABZ837_24805 [Streptomyces sp. NPDC047197]|uniref:hypothetical protein n=1 Tax=Streptomyces sp. NPDC047197 TaxID=3155477 RepID=UPI00340624AF